MKTLRIYPTSLNDRYIDQATDALSHGNLIIYPTDTLYAVACDALSQNAIERLCRFKNLNPQKNTLSIVCSDISQASEYARIDNTAFKILRQYTPGAFTFLLPAATTLPKAFKGRRVVGIRIPDNPIAQALARQLGHPIATSSLPIDGLSDDEISFPEDIMLRYDSNTDITLMIDGGRGATTPSTIVDITDSHSPQIVRQGAGIITLD